MHFWDFLEPNRSVASKPLKMCVNIIKDSERCIKYGNFALYLVGDQSEIVE